MKKEKQKIVDINFVIGTIEIRGVKIVEELNSSIIKDEEQK